MSTYYQLEEVQRYFMQCGDFAGCTAKLTVGQDGNFAGYLNSTSTGGLMPPTYEGVEITVLGNTSPSALISAYSAKINDHEFLDIEIDGIEATLVWNDVDRYEGLSVTMAAHLQANIGESLCVKKTYREALA